MSQRVLITGGRGTLGKKLVPRLQEGGYTVRISSRGKRPDSFNSTIEWAQASLESASGWAAAMRNVDVVMHLASSPFKRGLDVSGTGHILTAAKETGVQHFIFISIVGVDHRDWFFYEAKHICEEMIAASGIPYSIERATQFHDFVNLLLSDMFLRTPIGFLPKGWRIQPIDSGEVADLLFAVLQKGPSGLLPDAGGPEILTVQEIADIWMGVKGRRRIINIPFPFLMGRAFGTGHNLASDNMVGRITWSEWVSRNLATPNADR